MDDPRETGAAGEEVFQTGVVSARALEATQSPRRIWSPGKRRVDGEAKTLESGSGDKGDVGGAAVSIVHPAT
jgi:hypothetical protein